MKYKLVTDPYPDKLESGVNALLAQGWVPIGGVSFSSYGNIALFCQAMTCLDSVVSDDDLIHLGPLE